jgi:hypothetical protein
MIKSLRPVACFVAILTVAAGFAQSGLWVELSGSNVPTNHKIDQALRVFGKNAAKLTRAIRARQNMPASYQFSLPQTITLARNGKALEKKSYDPGDITLVFDSSGARSFPTAYKDLLQDVFNTAKPTLDIIFGQAANAGPVLVKNYDADIGDRDAVAGGAFLPNNGSGQPEIRFPVYVSPEATAVNFIHTLLLAYLGPNDFSFDAFQEGVSTHPWGASGRTRLESGGFGGAKHLRRGHFL